MPTFTGDADANTLTGADGDDTLLGLGGDDILNGGAGADILDGGEGTDTASYETATAGVTVNLTLQGGAQDTVGAGSDTLISIENLTGSAFDDTLTGDAGNNRLVDALGGNDRIAGGDGNDVIQITRPDRGAMPGDQIYSTLDVDGDAGDDVITVSGGRNHLIRGTIDGGDGDDQITVSLGSSSANPTSGTVVISGGDGADRITVSGDAASSSMSSQGLEISGGAGDDVITLHDSFRRNHHSARVSLGEGQDRLVLAGAFPDTVYDPVVTITDFTAGPNGDVLDIAAWLNSGAVPGYVPGTNPFETGLLTLGSFDGGRTSIGINTPGASHTIVVLDNVNPSDLTAYNLGGFRFLPTVINNASIREGSGDADTINGDAGASALAGFGGNDVLNGGDGGDVLFGDSWRGGVHPSGDDTLTGGAGNDTLVGGAGDDILNGGDGDDVMYTGVGRQWGAGISLSNLPNIETLEHQIDGGFDTVDGGAGTDTAHLMYSRAVSAIVLDNSDASGVNVVTVGGVARGSVSGVENLWFYGGSAGDTVTAGAGADALIGADGDDILTGGAGDDVLSGGAGVDRLDGGSGLDVASYADAAAGVSIDLATLAIGGGATGDVLIGIEGLTGSAYSDILQGDAGTNVLTDLLGGADVLEGRGGDDVLFVSHSALHETGPVRADGGDGDDVIEVDGVRSAQILGGAGVDSIILGARHEASAIDAGAGDDVVALDMTQASATITLGSGLDILVLNGLSWASKAQIVTDFVAGNAGDVIDLRAWINSGSYNPFASGQIRLVQSGADTLVQVSIIGDAPGLPSSWGPGLVLKNVQASSLTAANFRGYNPVPTGSTINGTGFSDTLTGTSGADEIIGQAGSDALRGGAGDDVIRAGGPTYAIPPLTSYGSALDGGEGNDILVSNDAFDVLIGGAGSDTLYGGDGNDLLIGGGGGFTANNQSVTVPGLGPVQVMIPGLVDPRLDDGIADRLEGGAGDDTIYIGRGDTALGGEGLDRLVAGFAWMTSGLTLDLSAPGFNATLGALIGATLSGFEMVTLDATDLADAISTSDGADNVNGAGGDDILIGGLGANILTGGLGSDNLTGGGGNDIIVTSHLSNSSQYRNAENLWVTAAMFDDGGVDVVDAGDGNDTVNIGYGDTADGGAGVDTLSLALVARNSGLSLDLRSDINATLSAAANATISNFEAISFLGLTNHNDVLRLGALNVTSVYGLQGDDEIHGNDLAQTLRGNEGDDRIEAYGGNDRLMGGAGNDVLLGGAGQDNLLGDLNDDSPNPAARGDDWLDGGADNDFIYGGDGADTLIGGLGNDILYGDRNPSDDGSAYANADTLDGGDGLDQLFGGGGDDRLTGGLGNDTIDGGLGEDTAVLAGARSAYTLTVQPNGSLRVVGPDGTDTLTSVERLQFSDGVVRFADGGFYAEAAGTAGDDVLHGGAAADMLLGRSGDDSLFGGSGDDVLDGGGGANLLNGGEGFDVVRLSGARSEYRLVETLNGLVLKGPGSGDRLVSVEELRFADGKVINLLLQGGPDGWGAFVDGAGSDQGPLIRPVESGLKGADPLVPDTLPGLADDVPFPTPEILPGPTAGNWTELDALVLPGEHDHPVLSGRGEFRPTPPVLIDLVPSPGHEPDWLL